MSVGLLLAGVLLAATRGDRVGRLGLLTAVAGFGALGLLDGRTLELWMWLRGWSGLGMDAASRVVDGSVHALNGLGWCGLVGWVARRGWVGFR